MTHTSQHNIHKIVFSKQLDPMKYDDLPEETACAFIGQMDPFPLGEILWIRPQNLADTCLFYQPAREVFFEATIDQILDSYAQYLNRLWRKEQKARIKALYWRARRRLRPNTATA